jgi:manganese oxidase
MHAVTEPERDPWFRALVLLTVAVLVVMVGANLIYGSRSSAASSSSSESQGGTHSMSHGDSGSSGAMSAEQMASMHEASMKAFPAKTQGLGGQLLVPTMENGGKVFHLMAMPMRWEVSPGQFVTAWAYNEQVPGPQIRVRQGDRIEIVLTNHLPEPTVIHWHGVTVPNAMDGVPYVTQDPVMARPSGFRVCVWSAGPEVGPVGPPRWGRPAHRAPFERGYLP